MVDAVSTNGSLYGATCHVGLKVITLTNASGDHGSYYNDSDDSGTYRIYEKKLCGNFRNDFRSCDRRQYRNYSDGTACILFCSSTDILSG